MKTKGFTILAMFCMVPLFFSSIFFGIIGVDYWLSSDQATLDKTLTGEVNNKILSIICLISLLSISIIFTYMTTIMRYSGSIDKIDQKLIDLDKETQEYRVAKEKFIKKTLEP